MRETSDNIHTYTYIHIFINSKRYFIRITSNSILLLSKKKEKKKKFDRDDHDQYCKLS